MPIPACFASRSLRATVYCVRHTNVEPPQNENANECITLLPPDVCYHNVYLHNVHLCTVYRHNVNFRMFTFITFTVSLYRFAVRVRSTSNRRAAILECRIAPCEMLRTGLSNPTRVSLENNLYIPGDGKDTYTLRHSSNWPDTPFTTINYV